MPSEDDELNVQVQKAKEKQNGDNYVHLGIMDTMKQGVLVDYLSKHMKEVEAMLTEEYNYEEELRVRTEEGRQEGLHSVAQKMLDDKLDIAFVAKYTDIPEDELKEMASTR